MNVSLQNIDKVSALLTVKLEKADYQEKVDKSLKKTSSESSGSGVPSGDGSDESGEENVW